MCTKSVFMTLLLINWSHIAIHTIICGVVYSISKPIIEIRVRVLESFKDMLEAWENITQSIIMC